MPLPQNLGGTEVLVAGRRAPLFFVGETQATIQIPWETQTGDQVEVQVTLNRKASPIHIISVSSKAPAIFFRDNHVAIAQRVVPNVFGPGQHDYRLTGHVDFEPARPDFLVVYATGLGSATTEVETGTAPSMPIPIEEVQAYLSAGPLEGRLEISVLGAHRTSFVAVTK